MNIEDFGLGLLKDSDFLIDETHIGSFHKLKSHFQPLNETIALLHFPVLYKGHNETILLNKENKILNSELHRIKKNIKIKSFVLIKSNLSLEALQSAFEIIDLKHLHGRDFDEKCYDIVVNGNEILNTICPKKTAQISFLHRKLKDGKTSPKTLSKYNKNLDIYLSNKLIKESKKSNDKFETEDIKIIVEKIKNSNSKIFLYDLLKNMINTSHFDIEEINGTIDFLSDRSSLKKSHIEAFNYLTELISKQLKNQTPILKIINLIKKIELIKKGNNEAKYNFITDALLNRSIEIEEISKYMSKELNKGLNGDNK